MFHRVKSETSVKDDEVMTVEATEQKDNSAQQDAAQAAQRAQKSTTMSQQELIMDEAPEQEAEETVEETASEEKSFSPAQNLYQRPSAAKPAAQPASRPASYSPRPAGYSAPASSTPARVSAPTSAAENAANDRRLTIGRGITMSGEIECCDELQVEGTVEAALKGATFLNIAESGVFYGTVEIEDAVIAGRFEGEIVVNGRLTVEETGVITGSISYKELEIKSGAIVDGRITPLNAQAAAKTKSAE
tara:strand:- start:83548 stop:84288 length:741 start_codon:yes stop_codon:yes gene_type:complete